MPSYLPQRLLEKRPRWQRIVFQENRLISQNEMGEETRQWVMVAERWGVLNPLEGQGFTISTQPQERTSHMLQVRKPRDGLAVQPEWRVKIGTRVFELAEPPRDLGERHEYVEALVVEKEEE